MHANLFSSLFLMAVAGVGVPDEKVRFYAIVNQCLRTLVTGCDNILDDEYKEVVPLGLTGSGRRFRSVLQIMTGDAVLARLLIARVSSGQLDAEKAARVSEAVLAVLIPSGVQEHEEESRLHSDIPSPARMIEDVHYRKTGLLFQAPLKLVAQVGDATCEHVEASALALSHFGIACQILDDAMDVVEDLIQHRFNLILSLACHGNDPGEATVVRDLSSQEVISEADAVRVAAVLSHATAAGHAMAVDWFATAYRKLSDVMPAFGMDAAQALGTLVQIAIMKERFVAPLGTQS